MATNIDDLPFNKPTDLPSRDIPKETIQHVTDPQVTPTYIPPQPPQYIEEQPKSYAPSKLDRWMDEFKLPVLLSVLFFIFQLSIVQNMMKSMIPSCFLDGQITMTGLGVKSGLFGVAYYAMMIFLDYLSRP
jgi:hypothetical protein